MAANENNGAAAQAAGADAGAIPKIREETRRMAIDETLLPYELDQDESRIQYSIKDQRSGAKDLLKFINDMELGNDTAPVKQQALGYYLANNRNVQRTMNISQKPDEYEGQLLSKFPLNTTTATTVDQVIGNVDDGEFKKFKFQSTYHEHVTKANLIDIALFKILSAPLANGDPNFANQVALKTTLLEAKMGINAAKVARDHEEAIEKRVRLEMAKANNITAANTSHFVVCPELGRQTYPSGELKTTLTKLINNTPFGQPGNHRPLKDYLSILTSVIAGVFDQAGAYDLLLHILAGLPRQYVKHNVERGLSFKVNWSQLQLAYSSKESASELLSKLSQVLRTRPNNMLHAITKIVHLVLSKNQLNEFEPGELKVINNLEIKNCIMVMLTRFYPSWMPIIRRQYDGIVQSCKANNLEMNPPDVVLATLISDTIRNAPPQGGKVMEIHESATSEVKEFERSNGFLTEEDLFTMTEPEEESEQGEPTDVEAFQTRRPPPRGRPNQRYPNSGARPRNRFRVPENMRGRCLLCGSQDHVMSQCNCYSDRQLNTRKCNYCDCYHRGKCRNNQPKVYEIEYQEPEIEYVEGEAADVHGLTYECEEKQE